MKKRSLKDLGILALMGFACVLGVGIVSVQAEETGEATASPGERVRENIAERQEIREERREVFTSTIQDRIVNLSNNVAARLSSVLVRMDHIAARLETRIDKLTHAGVDTSSARAKLTEAQKTIDNAQAKLSSLSSASNAIRSDSPRETFALVRAQFTEIRDLARQAHTLLKETVSLLKNAVQTAELNQGVSSGVTEVQQETPSVTE
jgi:ABC-type transporter Mla subunit MlaD